MTMMNDFTQGGAGGETFAFSSNQPPPRGPTGASQGVEGKSTQLSSFF
jgi:hypothetical protein